MLEDVIVTPHIGPATLILIGLFNNQGTEQDGGDVFDYPICSSGTTVAYGAGLTIVINFKVAMPDHHAFNNQVQGCSDE